MQLALRGTTRMLAGAGMALTMLFAPGCDDDEDTLAPSVASELNITAGNNQNVPVTTAATTPLTVTVLDQYNDPMSGVTVNWVVVSGDGTLTSASSVTDADGNATMAFTAGTTVGAVTVTATVAGLTPATFTLNVQ